MWDAVRERERLFALETARTQSGRGQCAKTLQSLNRSQARIDLGLYSREATVTRARCYDKLGLTELAAAHRRLVDDFYTNEPMALPEPGGSSIFRAPVGSEGRFFKPPAWLKIPPPMYSEYARRSKIIGRVIVAFDLAGNDRPKRIRVLEMSHPLLATWAIEAIGAAEPKKKKDAKALMPGGRYVSAFVFAYRWATPEIVDDYDY